jgi:hypothetical protein
MGHLIFVALHVIAALFAPVLLFVTVPLHLVYAALSTGNAVARRAQPTPATHVRCPDCKELVHREANVCPHCACALLPQPTPKRWWQ